MIPDAPEVTGNRATRRAATRRGRKLAAIGSGAVLASTMAAGAMAAFPQAAGAATITVTNLNDSGTGSLREALTNANPGDTIDLTGLSGTITLTSGELDIHDAVTITGPGASALTVSGNGASGVFSMDTDLSGGTVTISGLTITGGNAGAGGGVFFNCDTGSGNLVIDSSVVTGNTSGDLGGGLYFDRCDEGGSMTVRNSVVSNNSSTGDGAGGIWFDEGTGLTIEGSTISGNQAHNWDGGGVVFDDGGSFTLLNSTVSGNSSSDNGGGLAIHRPTVGSTIANSTISGNTAQGNGGGVELESGPLSLEQATISGNTATGHGDGLYMGYGAEDTAAGAVRHDNQGAAPSSAPNPPAATVIGTIVAANADGSDDIARGADSQGTLSLTSSVVGAVNGVTPTDGGGNQTGVTNPGLAPLANNGGATETQALLPGSSAIDAGPATVPSFPGNDFDQRGSGFARVVNGKVDVGAFEVQPPPTPAPEVIVQPKFTG